MKQRIHEFIAELAHNPVAVANILRTHTPDEHDKCAGCYLDDKQRKPWPCIVHYCADQASERLRTAELAAGVVRLPQQRKVG